MAPNEPEDFDVEPWERWTIGTCGTDEPAALFAIFEAYLRTSPRSVRAALARVRGLEGDAAKNIRASGALQRSVRIWRWSERAASWDLHVAEQEKAAFEKARREARRRRVAMLDRATVLIAERLASMKDLKRMPAHRVIDAMVKTMESSRLEMRDGREDDAAHANEHEPPLPAIEDVIRPPEPVDHKPPDPE